MLLTRIAVPAITLYSTLLFLPAPALAQGQPASCEVKAGQMLMAWHKPAPLVGGVFLQSVGTRGDVKAMQKGRTPPLFVAVDGENGRVLEPNSQEVGLTKDEKYAYGIARLSAQELEARGVNWNFGTVVDVGSGFDPVGRELSSDPKRVGELGLQQIKGQESAGILGTIKHFPGLGDAGADTHRGPSHVDKTWEELEAKELIPFRHIIDHSLFPPAVMVSHLSLPKALSNSSEPASLNPEVVTGYLRNKLGHKGLIVSDALDMGAITKRYQPYEAVKKAILAGNDVVLLSKFAGIPQQEEFLHQLCADSLNDPELSGRIENSYKRILKTKKRYTSAAAPPETAAQARARHSASDRYVKKFRAQLKAPPVEVPDVADEQELADRPDSEPVQDGKKAAPAN